MAHCNILPRKGQNTFIKLNKEFGRNTAVDIFTRIITNEFKQMFGDSLLYEEGVPTFESIIALPIIRDFVGQQKLADNLNKRVIHYLDNSENVSMLINQALEFNSNPINNQDLVAYIDYDEKGNIYVKVSPKTQETLEIAQTQYKILKMEEKAVELLKPAGITIEDLTPIEKAAGRVGVTEFNHISGVLNDFSVVIRIANNLEGRYAVGEEISHVLIGINRDNIFVQRSIDYLKNELVARAVLGDDEYYKVYEFYNGDMELVAEEAAGHILKEHLENKTAGLASNNSKVFKRMFTAILERFKGIDAVEYLDSLQAIISGYEEFAEDYISGKKQISKADIQKARRIAIFNALSEKVLTLLDILKQFNIDEYKNSMLLLHAKLGREYGDTKKLILSNADKMKKILLDAEATGETMRAIASFVSLALDSLKTITFQLNNIDNVPFKESFAILLNAINTQIQYEHLVEQISVMTAENFLQDEDIKNQSFMLDDMADSLKDFRGDPVSSLNTKGMSSKDIVKLIIEDGEGVQLSEDKTHYVDKLGRKSMRVTSTITATKGEDEFDSNSPYYIPSTNIGTGIDELTRDFFNDKLTKKQAKWFINGKNLSEVYPNATEEDLLSYVSSLEHFKKHLQKKHITIVARDIIAQGTIDTVDGQGKKHTVRVAGTLDLLGYDRDGNWYIFDMKTHRGDITLDKEEHWRKLLSLYADFLEKRYGISIVETNIIPIKVNYPAPFGSKNGTVKYQVSLDEKPQDYNGAENNQIIADGELFKGARPYRERTRTLQRKEVEFEYKTLADDPTDGLGNSILAIKAMVKDLTAMIFESKKIFNDVAFSYFIDFLKMYIDDTLKVPDPENPGKFTTISLEDAVLKTNTDVTWLQRYFTTMADNPDVVLQIYDKIIKDKKHEKRFKVIDYAQKITALGLKYEKLGITDYLFMFEEDKENYINIYYSGTAYKKALAEFDKKLEEKYGKTIIGSKEHILKRKERQDWIASLHKKMFIRGSWENIPNPEYYPSTFNSLSDAQKNLYMEWIDIKSELDELLGDKTYLTNSIKIRNHGFERLKNFAKGDFNTVIESAKAAVLKSYDDETSYAKGIRDLEGNERRVLPTMYLSLNGESAKDVSTDIISTLIAYADMACNYEAMNEIVNPLELGKYLMKKHRKIEVLRKNKTVKEIFTPTGEKEVLNVTVNVEESTFYKTLKDLLDSKLYGIHLEEATEIFGADANKVVSNVTTLGSYLQMGFNFIANTANLLNGIAQMNVEAFAKEYFTAKELFNADKIYASEYADLLGDVGCRAKKAKLSLISEKLNLRLDFEKHIRHKNFKNRNFILRIFGPSLAFVGQEITDHYLYHRAAIAFLLTNYKFLYNNLEVKFWDIWEKELIDPNNEAAGYRIVIKEGVTNLDGSEITSKDMIEWSNRVSEMSKQLFGVYNLEDTINARRTLMGKPSMLYRDWMPTAIRRRWGKASGRLEAGPNAEREGFYLTTGRFLKHLSQDLIRGEMNIAKEWNSLENYERRNLKRALGETINLIGIWIVYSLLRAPDLKDRSWLRRFLATLARREFTELGAFNPLGAPSELLKIMDDPMAATDVLNDIWQLRRLLWIPNYTDEIELGKYAGHSTAYKAFMQSPFTTYYRTAVKTVSPEISLNWYEN